MEKTACAGMTTATDLEFHTLKSIKDLSKKRFNVHEAMFVQRSVHNMIQLAKTQLEQNKFLNKKEEVLLLRDKK